MKIVIAVSTYYPFNNGVSNVTQYQAAGLAALGHEVTVITTNHVDKTETEIHNGIAIWRINGFTDYMLHFGDKRAYQRLLQEYASQADVIMTVCPQSWCTDWAIPMVSQLPCAMMMMVHGIHDYRWTNFRDRSAYAIARKLWGDVRWRPFFAQNWKYIRQYDAIAQLHEQDFATQYFRRHGVKRDYILYNAVDDEFFEPEEHKEKQIINIGKYSRNKNQMACLKAFYQAQMPDWTLVLIGSSKTDYYYKLLKYREKLEQRYGSRKVEILVGISRKQTIERVRQSQIYLLASISEMFPVSLLEGMASGCAWISTDVGVDRYLPGGLICNTPAEMAGALESLSDEDKRKRLGEQGRQFAWDNCRKEMQVRRLESILQQAVEHYSERENDSKRK